MPDKREYWSVVTPMPAPILTQQAQQLEAMGVEGLFAPQVYGPPFLPLAAAATVTNRVKLASGIALGFVRSPFETAMTAIDLDRISGGRFVLGLGASVRAWSEGIFGMPYGKPVEHLREVVDIVRAVIAKAHTGELREYKGKYHHLDLRDYQPMGEPLRTDIPIWIATLRGPLIRMGAEVADGVMGHPIWSVKWATEQLPGELERGLSKGGRTRDQVHVNIWQWVAINPDPKEAVQDAKTTVAFYAGAEQYEEYFAAHGFREEARRAQQGIQRGDYRSVSEVVPDEMARTFVACGTKDEVRAKLEPLWQVADSVCYVPPGYGLDPAKFLTYAAAIGETFYG